jgi:hypothetical protein
MAVRPSQRPLRGDALTETGRRAQRWPEELRELWDRAGRYRITGTGRRKSDA